jgi:hypothetical protein
MALARVIREPRREKFTWGHGEVREGRRRGGGGDTHIVELLWVEGAVPVSAFGDWLRDHHTGSVDGLPAVLEIDPSGDLFDEHGGESLGSAARRERVRRREERGWEREREKRRGGT